MRINPQKAPLFGALPPKPRWPPSWFYCHSVSAFLLEVQRPLPLLQLQDVQGRFHYEGLYIWTTLLKVNGRHKYVIRAWPRLGSILFWGLGLEHSPCCGIWRFIQSTIAAMDGIESRIVWKNSPRETGINLTCSSIGQKLDQTKPNLKNKRTDLV